MIRPELLDRARRWREVLAGLAAGLLGGWWILGVGGLLAWIGVAFVAGGAALAVVGLQRARFRAGGDGPGVVQVDEGRIAYFGPLTGGVMAAADLDRLTLDPTARPAHWVLERRGAERLEIPVNAVGSEALFDVFATLPGLRTERMLAELNGAPQIPVLIWERRPDPPSDRLLH